MEDEKGKVAQPEMSIEPEVVFNSISDLTVFAIQSEETKETMFEISGYGLNVKINHDQIHSLGDVDSLLEGIKNLFGKLILQEFIPKTQEKQG